MFSVQCNFKYLSSAKYFAEEVSKQWPDATFELFELPELNISPNLFDGHVSLDNTCSIRLEDLRDLSSAIKYFKNGVETDAAVSKQKTCKCK